MHACTLYACDMCTVVQLCTYSGRDQLWELVLSSFYVSGIQTQVAALAWRAPLPAEPSLRPQTLFFETVSFTDPQHAVLTCLAGQLAPGIHLSLSLKCWGYRYVLEYKWLLLGCWGSRLRRLIGKHVTHPAISLAPHYVFRQAGLKLSIPLFQLPNAGQ